MTPDELKELLKTEEAKLQAHVDEWAGTIDTPNGLRIKVSLSAVPAPMIPVPVPPEEVAATRAMLLRTFYSAAYLFPNEKRWPNRLESETRNQLAKATFGKPHFSDLTVNTFLERWDVGMLVRQKGCKWQHVQAINEHLLKHGLPEITGSERYKSRR